MKARALFTLNYPTMNNPFKSMSHQKTMHRIFCYLTAQMQIFCTINKAKASYNGLTQRNLSMNTPSHSNTKSNARNCGNALHTLKDIKACRHLRLKLRNKNKVQMRMN